MGSVVTVAELMRRCAPAPEVEDDRAAPIPVSALLRREGRSATGLPVVQAPAVGEILSTLPGRQPLLRRGAMAAGALLAAGSVFGLTAAMNAPFTPPTSSGTFPDQGEPSGPGSPTALDAGQAAPSTWLPVAFPTLFPEANAPAPQAAAPRAVAQPVAAQAPAANSGGTARQASSAGSLATSAPRSTPAKKEKDGSSVVGGTVDTVGGVVSEVGENTPLKPVTDGLGNTVSGVGRQVGAITDPITDPITLPLTTTVKRVVAPLTTPVTTLLTPTPSSAPTSSSSSKAPSTSSAPSSSAKPSTSASPTGIVKDLLN